jgi:chromosome partitioning protein
MTGNIVAERRAARGQTQEQFAAYLNGYLGRRYDKSRISRWESGREAIPADIAVFLHSASTRKALIVAVTNQKGGVAKTTTTLNLAALLGQRGVKVCVIDADSQCNATIGVGVDPIAVGQERRGLYEVLIEGKAAVDTVMPVVDGLFDLLPTSQTLAAADMQLIADPSGGQFRLHDQVVALGDGYDVILIDTPPTLAMMTLNALFAADLVLIPVQTHPYAVVGMDMLLQTIAKARRRNPNLQVLGVLPTLYAKGESSSKRSYDDLVAIAEDAGLQVFPPIPRAADFTNALQHGRPLLSFDGVRDILAQPFQAMADAIVV